MKNDFMTNQIYFIYFTDERMKRREVKEIDGVLYIQCNRCKEFKEASKKFFAWNHMWYLWLNSICKECHKDIKRRFVINNREKIRAYERMYYANNKEKAQASNRAWREKNKERIKETVRRYRSEHEDLVKKRRSNYSKRYKKEINEKNKERGKIKWYTKPHRDVWRLLRKLSIRPNICPICMREKNVYAHHPDYSKPYEIVFCCQSCHANIHKGLIECPSAINLLDYKDKKWRIKKSI